MTLGLLAFGVGLPEILILVVVVLLLFGPSKLPQLGEGVGKMLRGFKKEMKALDDERTADASAAKDAKAAPDNEIDVTPRAPETDSTRKTG